MLPLLLLLLAVAPAFVGAAERAVGPTGGSTADDSTEAGPNAPELSGGGVIAESGSSLCIQAVGDLSLAGSAAPVIRKRGAARAFDGTRKLLAECPVNVANLETAVTNRGEKAKKTFTFRMPPEDIPAVRAAGFNLVSLANNHTLDYGLTGLLDTFAALNANGVAHAGAGRNVRESRKPAVVTANGVTVGLLSFSNTFPEEFWATDDSPGTTFGHERWVIADVASLRRQVDVVLVAFHWGAERSERPKEYQQLLAKAAVESGADAVIGHHPHVLQGIELIQGRPVLYSLGNYAFGSYSAASKDSALARFEVKNGKIDGLTIVPLNVWNQEVAFNPQVAEGEEATRILSHLAGLSRELGTATEILDGRLVVPLSPAVVEAK